MKKKERRLKLRTKHIIYILIGLIVLSMLYALKNTSYFVRASGFILSILIFFLCDYFFVFGFKKHHYLIFILISVVGILLSPLYFLFSVYDKILHLTTPMLICILIFYLTNRLKTKFSIKLAITFFVIVGSLAIFEVGEYSLDKIFNWQIQGVYIRDYSGIEKLNIIMDKNDDTMIDLVAGIAGSLLFVAAKTGIFYYRKFKIK